MSRLNNNDFQQLLFAINRLNSCVAPETLPARTLGCVSSLIPNEMTAFDGFDIENNYSGSYWYSPPDTVSDEKVQIFGELILEHPYYQDAFVNRKEITARVTDYISLAEFHRTALYNEFYKHIGGDTQMTATLYVTPKFFVTCSLLRMKNDFSDRDLEVLNYLVPHLISAFRNSQFVERLTNQREELKTALEAAKYGVITIDADLNIETQNSAAVALMQKYFKPLSNNALPDELSRYVSHHRQTFSSNEFFFPPAPLEIKRKNSRLKIRLTFQPAAQTIVLLLEEVKEPLPEDYVGLGLTQRESEILFWITQGKTNSEIAYLCEISIRTVQKHIENIYVKLGVETRASATALAIESIR